MDQCVHIDQKNKVTIVSKLLFLWIIHMIQQWSPIWSYLCGYLTDLDNNNLHGPFSVDHMIHNMGILLDIYFELYLENSRWILWVICRGSLGLSAVNWAHEISSMDHLNHFHCIIWVISSITQTERYIHYNFKTQPILNYGQIENKIGFKLSIFCRIVNFLIITHLIHFLN